MRHCCALLVLAGSVFAAGEPARFEAAGTCAFCHSEIPAPDDAPSGVSSIAPFALWSGSMKAHAARDPFWKAKIRFETALTPAAAGLIEDKCLRCHAPIQQYNSRPRGMRLQALDDAGREGVGCTVCHQIASAGFGTRASFTGGFLINDRSEIYGPHEQPFLMPMLHHTGYQPVASRHVLEAALCATCHTVITPSLTAGGTVDGEFVEQAPFLEWLAGGYSEAGVTCQSCHMPALKDRQGRNAAQYIAHRPPGGPFPPTRPRAPFGLHYFVGGNAQVPAMLAELLPDEAALLRRTSDRAALSLENAVALEAAAVRTAGPLEVRVTVRNRTGHKLPTAFPSRRLWLYVAVTDSSGARVFESGAGGGHGQSVEPHYRTISGPGQTMVYEAEYHDGQGRPTTSLLRATGYLKDNRILPRGFDPKRRLPSGLDTKSILPVGTGDDPDFLPGSDTVTYRVDTAGRPGPFRVLVEARFQSVKPAHAAALASVDHPDARSFVELQRKHPAPITVARVELTGTR